MEEGKTISNNTMPKMEMDGLPSNIQDKYTILKLNKENKILNEKNETLKIQMKQARETIIQNIIGDTRASADTMAFRHVELFKLIQVLIRRPPEIKYIQERHWCFLVIFLNQLVSNFYCSVLYIYIYIDR